MNGFVNVLKPVGATASDVVVCLKHILHEKVGHLGTLDPGASGVLPVAVGKATKLFDLLTNKIKYYRAFFTFGKTTDTLDAYGEVTDTCDKIPDEAELARATSLLTGKIQQVPPQYSAISVGGVRAYKFARSGQQVALSPRNIEVYRFSLLRRQSQNTFVFDIECSGGTYVRSLARDLAASCNTVGFMSGLIRLSSGRFDIADAYTLDEIRDKGVDCLLDVTYPLSDMPDFVLPDAFSKDLACGRTVRADFDGLRKIYCGSEFWGLGKSYNGCLKLDYYLRCAETGEK